MNETSEMMLPVRMPHLNGNAVLLPESILHIEVTVLGGYLTQEKVNEQYRVGFEAEL